MNEDLSEVISQHYRKYLGREPDKGGLEYHLKEIESGRLREEDSFNHI